LSLLICTPKISKYIIISNKFKTGGREEKNKILMSLKGRRSEANAIFDGLRGSIITTAAAQTFYPP
jgi:hypothetical protein